LFVLIQQAKIDSPGIHPQALQWVLQGRFLDARLDILPLARQVPVDAVRLLDRRVQETMRFCEAESAVTDRAYDCPSTFSTQVQCQVVSN